MIRKFTNGKMANGLAFSHVQEIRAKGSTTAGFLYKFSTTVLRPFCRCLSEKFIDDHQPHTGWHPFGSQLFKDPQ